MADQASPDQTLLEPWRLEPGLVWSGLVWSGLRGPLAHLPGSERRTVSRQFNDLPRSLYRKIGGKAAEELGRRLYRARQTPAPAGVHPLRAGVTHCGANAGPRVAAQTEDLWPRCADPGGLIGHGDDGATTRCGAPEGVARVHRPGRGRGSRDGRRVAPPGGGDAQVGAASQSSRVPAWSRGRHDSCHLGCRGRGH